VALCIPEAFDEEALLFACAYGVVRYGQIALFLVASRDQPELRRSVITGLVGSTTISIALLVGGSFADTGLQEALWALALVLDMAGPLLFGVEGWQLVPGHFAERHGLIVIIALGESIVAIGQGVATEPISTPVIVASVLGLTVTGCLWWAYFDVVSLIAERVLRRAQGEERARLARDAYSYLHLPMIAGIVLLALGMKKVMEYVSDVGEHELSDALTFLPLAALFGGAALFLLGHAVFTYRVERVVKVQRVVTAALLVALIPVGTRIPALAALALTAVILSVMIGLESVWFAETREQIRHEEDDAVSHLEPH